MEERSFIGPKLDLFETFGIGTKGWKIGAGGEIGCFYSRVRNDNLQPLVFDFTYEYFEFYPNYKSNGNLFLMPLETYILIGHKEDFLIAGVGLEWLQFMGENHYVAQGHRYTYRIHEPNVFYNINIGYRHIPSDKGVCFELSWKPYWRIIEEKLNENAFSIALGYRF